MPIRFLLSSRFDEALAYAAELHAGQVRKGTSIPYISHPIAVCALVLEDGGDEDEAIAALLHDGPEDAGGGQILNEIERRFGTRVSGVVHECSDTLEDPKPPWRQRKVGYLAHLEHASDEALRVSLADKLHNLGSILRDYDAIGDNLWRRFNASRDDTIWYYSSLARVFSRRRPGQMANELNNRVEELGKTEQRSPRAGDA